MSRPRVVVVGLGPGDADLVTKRSERLIHSANVVRLRTKQHPAARAFKHVPSYDDWYDEAENFEDLYQRIAADLVQRATRSPDHTVVYVVPGSGTVAERTVEILRDRGDVEVVCEPAVSVIDVACAVLGYDPLHGLRVVDALENVEPLRGPGPLLILQTYSVEILASVASRVPKKTPFTVLHHLGLRDQQLRALPADELTTFEQADHLTSLWLGELRTPGVAVDDLVDLVRRLRRDCPWDAEQTHASLTRHLLEEAYEALDALESYAGDDVVAVPDEVARRHVEEELGDLLVQIIFHAELGDEDDAFSMTTISDGVREKLIGRHPHVFGDVTLATADEVADQWEERKMKEKGRTSVIDGVAWQAPSLSLYQTLLRKQRSLDTPLAPGTTADFYKAVSTLQSATDETSMSIALGDIVVALVRTATEKGVDLETIVRRRATELREQIVAHELSSISQTARTQRPLD